VTLIPGDGIGQELASSVKTVFNAAHVPVDFDQHDVTGYTDASDTTFRQAVESLRLFARTLRASIAAWSTRATREW